MVNAHDDKIEQLRQQLAEAEAAKKVAEKEASRRIQRARRDAGDSHTKVTLALYDLLEVAPEHPTSRTKNGKVFQVATDRAENLRTGRLYSFVAGLVEAADADLLSELKLADQESRDDRRAARGRKASPPVPSTNSTAVADTDSDHQERTAAWAGVPAMEASSPTDRTSV